MWNLCSFIVMVLFCIMLNFKVMHLNANEITCRLNKRLNSSLAGKCDQCP